MRARATSASKSRIRGLKPCPPSGRGAEPREPSAPPSAHEEKPARRTASRPRSSSSTTTSVPAARGRGRAAVRAPGRQTGCFARPRLHDRLRLHDGLRLRAQAPAPAARGRPALRDGRPARVRPSTGALRTGAGCVLVTGGGSGVTAFGGGSGDGVAARAGTARTTHSTARAPTGAPLRRSNDRLPCRAISPRSPGLFSKLLRFLGCVNEALRPAGRPEAGLRGAAFCHSARDLPVAFAAASCSAADRPIANWLFFADWPTACVPPPPD